MKKVFAVMAIVGMFAFVACGPKAEEKSEATEQVQDAADAATEAVNETANEAVAAIDSTADAAVDSVSAAVAQ